MAFSEPVLYLFPQGVPFSEGFFVLCKNSLLSNIFVRRREEFICFSIVFLYGFYSLP